MSRIVFVLFTIVAFPCFCQSALENPVSRFFKLYPQEEAFLITDNTTYMVGERIWFKLYLWNGIDEKLSEDVRVLLRDAEGRVVEEQQLIMNRGEANGDFQLPTTLDNGVYRVDVVTDWSMNFKKSPIVTRLVTIGRGSAKSKNASKNETMVVAEGGGIVAGKQNRIGFFTGRFSAVPFRVEVKAPDGDIIFQNNYTDAVYVVETIAIENPGEYSISVCINSTECSTKKLATVTSVLTLDSHVNDVLTINVHGNENHAVAISSANDILDFVNPDANGKVQFKTSEYPAGLFYVLLIDMNERTIESSLALYKSADAPQFKFNIKHLASETSDFISTNVNIESHDTRTPIHAVIASADAITGNYMVSDLPATQIRDLLIFEKFPHRQALAVFLKDGKINLKKKLPSPVLEVEAPTTPLNIVLSEVYAKTRIDSVIQVKKIINRIKKDYQPEEPLQYALPISDDTFIPSEYTSINTATEFLNQAIPRLKRVQSNSSAPYRFLYTNLKDQKHLYNEPPALVVNGFKLPSFSALDAFPREQIKRIQALYNSRTLVETNLQTLLPGGALFVSVDPDAKPLGQMKELQRFSGQYAWPHYYAPFSDSQGGDRIPVLNQIYYWTNYGTPMREQYDLTVNLPTYRLQRTILMTFSLQSVRNGTYSKIVLDEQL